MSISSTTQRPITLPPTPTGRRRRDVNINDQIEILKFKGDSREISENPIDRVCKLALPSLVNKRKKK